MKKIFVALALVTSGGLLSSCKLTHSLQAALQTFQQDGATANVDSQAIRNALAQAEQAAQAAKAAQAQAEQAAAAAAAAQSQVEQALANLQNSPPPPPIAKTTERKNKKDKIKPVKTVQAPPVVKREPQKQNPPVARPTVAAAPVSAPAPQGSSEQKNPSFITAQAEASLEAEEADAAEAADNYAAKRAATQPKRSPASVGGAARAFDKATADRKAENEARFKRALSLFESKDEQEQVKLTIIEPDGTRKLREVFVSRLGFEGEQRMLARVLSPADLKGAGVLVIATKQRDNQWVYLPSSKQTRKVVVAEQKGVILGSELRYEDFNPAAIRRSNVELLKQERIEGKTYDIFEATIPPGTVPYEKAWVWIDPKSEMPIQIEYFVANEKVKRIEFMDYYKVGDIWRPARLAIKNLKTKRGTDIEISNVKVNAGLPTDRVTVEALSKVW